jgi:hypothetical protein
MEPLDAELVQVYQSFGFSVDRIACSITLRNEFRSRLPAGSLVLDDDELVRRLLNLRKRGKLSKSQGV